MITDSLATACGLKTYRFWVAPTAGFRFRNLAVSGVIVEAMEELKMHLPKPIANLSKIQFE